MKITPVKTRLMYPPQDDLFELISASINRIKEKTVLVVASKVVAIHQGRTLKYTHPRELQAVIQKEADKFFRQPIVSNPEIYLTIKDNLITANAGIDETNGNGYIILWPENISSFCWELRSFLQQQYDVKEIGVIVSDGFWIPMRQGVVGISLGNSGILPVRSYVGTKDLFGKEFRLTKTNMADSIAIAASSEMGEGAESSPLALVEEVRGLVFIEHPNQSVEFSVPVHQDMFGPLLNSVNWEKHAA